MIVVVVNFSAFRAQKKKRTCGLLGGVHPKYRLKTMQKLLQLPATNPLQLYDFRDENFETAIVIVVLTY